MIKICHWEITKKCNLSCLHCISSPGEINELKNEDCLKTIDILSHLGCQELFFTGGEALVKKDIWKIVKRAKEKRFKIGLFTNGILINKNNISLFKKFIDIVGISIDGSCPRINDRIRGKGSFFKTKNALILLQKNGIHTSVYFTINKINYYDVENFISFLKSIKIIEFKINEITLRGRAYINKDILEINKKEKRILKENILKSLAKFPSIINLTNLTEDDHCDVNPETMFISPSGNIYPCVEVFQKNQRLHCGNILTIKSKNLAKYFKTFKNTDKKSCPYTTLYGTDFSISLNNYSNHCAILRTRQ